jgi:ankyrin repeat protein
MDNSAARLVLKTLPRDLNETYDRILRNIPHTRVHNAVKLLQLLVYSERPLLLEEVVDALATEPDLEPPFALDNRIDPPEAIIGYCPGLVRLTTIHDVWHSESIIGHGFEAKLTIQLAHSSVQEYLLLIRKENPHYESFVEEIANATMTQICVAYLWTAAQASGAEHSASGFPLAEYAAKSWLGHARIAGDSDETTFTWTSRSITNDKFRWYWLRLYRPWAYTDRSLTSVLYFTSRNGLWRSVKHLLEAGADVNSVSGIDDTALKAACKCGSMKTVRVLIDHGAHLNPEEGDQNALHIAASYHRVEILHILLDNGADVNATGSDSETALFLSSYGGHVESVRALLERGADPNLSVTCGTALQKACQGPTTPGQAPGFGYAEVVRMLLDHGANVNGHMEGTTPALSLACACGHMETVQMLLDHGADVNARDEKFGTALGIATYYDHEEVVKTLLDQGADVNTHVGNHGSAVRLACRSFSGHINQGLVQLLLDNGADPNPLEGEQDNAICAAEVVKMLIQRGAYVNAAGRNGEMALSIAACYGCTEVLHVLLYYGASSDTHGRLYRNALENAVMNGHTEIAETLFEEGAKRQLAMTSSKCGSRLKVRIMCDVGNTLD